MISQDPAGGPQSGRAPASSPTSRAPESQIMNQVNELDGNQMLQDLLNAVGQPVALLNKHWQIVSHNEEMASLARGRRPAGILGLRPGEVLECTHADQNELGCGNEAPCSACGLSLAMTRNADQHAEAIVWRVLREEPPYGLCFSVQTTQFQVGDESYTVFAATDITDTSRKKFLQKSVLPDILSSSVELQSLCRTQKGNCRSHVHFARCIDKIAKQMTETVQARQDLAAAEKQELFARPSRLKTLPVLSELRASFLSIADHQGCDITIAPESRDVNFISDPILLSRVLSNLIQNAVEASQAADTVTLGIQVRNQGVEFQVHNQTSMPERAQHHLFEPGFSTKSDSRGMGAYSAKLIVEHYLNGKVDFDSSSEDGTTVRIWLPMELKCDHAPGDGAE